MNFVPRNCAWSLFLIFCQVRVSDMNHTKRKKLTRSVPIYLHIINHLERFPTWMKKFPLFLFFSFSFPFYQGSLEQIDFLPTNVLPGKTSSGSHLSDSFSALRCSALGSFLSRSVHGSLDDEEEELWVGQRERERKSGGWEKGSNELHRDEKWKTKRKRRLHYIHVYILLNTGIEKCREKGDEREVIGREFHSRANQEGELVTISSLST